MKPIWDMWCKHIEVTNVCGRGCVYCTRYVRHLKKENLFFLSLDQVEAGLLSIKEDTNHLVGIMGGEPILHPQFREICELCRKHIPRHRMHLWSSGGDTWAKYQDDIYKTFAHIAYNPHNEEQRKVCLHQLLTLSSEEIISDKLFLKELIEACWVQLNWCPSINHKGAFFCEVAAALDVLLDGPGGYPVDQHWWKKTPTDFQDQVDRWCGKCGMCVPLPREPMCTSKEKFTPGLLALFRSKGLPRCSDGDVEVVDIKLDRALVDRFRKGWNPGNYRQDIWPEKEKQDRLPT